MFYSKINNMNNRKLLIFFFVFFGISLSLPAQESANFKKVALGKRVFELHNVTGEIIRFQGQKVLKIERDLNAIPFDSTNIEATVDEPHYAGLVGLGGFRKRNHRGQNV